MNKTSIAWTDYTWNPITGCTAVSDGCKNCYAKTVHERFNKDIPFSEIVFHEDRLSEPSKVKKGKKIFVGSMTDLFQNGVEYKWVAYIMAQAIMNPQHTFQVLTKRPEKMKEAINFMYLDIADTIKNEAGYKEALESSRSSFKNGLIQNLWLGVTAENQKEADVRIPILLDIPASKRFVSIEPMIGSIDLTMLFPDVKDDAMHYVNSLTGRDNQSGGYEDKAKLDWVIVGGESGAKSKCREMKPEWVQKIYENCKANEVPFFFKQWGSHKPNESFEFEDVQEFPEETRANS